MKKAITIACYTILFSIIISSFNTTEIVTGKESTVIGTAGDVMKTSFTIGDLIWIEDSFLPDHQTGFAEAKEEDFVCDVSSSEIHVYETSDSYYGVYAGVYALVQNNGNNLEIQFDGRASSSRRR